MKIEKLNDNQIRCTLTRDDLASRKIKLSELAYGGEKAKALFREMMQQAAFEYGFEANDIPLMIEAIPLSSDSLVLIITKVVDPDELDTRFARFGSAVQTDPGTDPDGSFSSLKLEGADDVLNLFQKIKDIHKNITSGIAESTSPEEGAASPEDALPVDIKKMYGFHDLNEVIRVARLLNGFFHGENSLYKERAEDEYYLILSSSDHTPEEFNKICNILSEYGEVLKYAPGTESYFKEHGKVIVSGDALQKLGTL